MNLIRRIFGQNMPKSDSSVPPAKDEGEISARESIKERQQGMIQIAQYYALCKEISKVSINGFVKPEAGMRVDDIAISISDGEPYEIDTPSQCGESFWHQPALGGVLPLRWEFPSAVSVGETYHLVLPIKASKGYIFAEQVMLIVNGEPVDYVSEPLWNGGRIRECTEGFSWQRDRQRFDRMLIGWTTKHTCVCQY